MKGRKATPTALKKLRGTDQPCRLNKNEMDVENISKLPPPPTWFSKLAKKIYKTKGDQLIALKVISLLDIDQFLIYCNEYAIYIETSEQLAKIPNNAGMTESAALIYERIEKKNQRAWDRAKNIATQFGFTPSSRANLKIEPKKKVDDFEAFLNDN